PFIGKTGHAQTIKDIHAIGQRTAGIRRLGSAALDFAWVACGRYDAFFERNLKPWDVAAGILFVTEAGGIVTTIANDGDPKTGVSVLAANPELHPQLRKVLQAA
ncbi:inositol monophosphatase family protein, partial [Brevundimonas sp.]